MKVVEPSFPKLFNDDFISSAFSKRRFELPTPSEGVENLRARHLGTLWRANEVLSTETARKTMVVRQILTEKYIDSVPSPAT